MNRVLILSITAGQGHHQCAMALMDYFKTHETECKMVDCLSYINPLLGESVSQVYLASTQYSPSAYGKLYRLAEKKEKADSPLSISRVSINLLAKKLEKYVFDYNPDAIICTHVFAAQLATEFKYFKCKSIGIITDFTIHPFWEDTKMNYYVTASELLNNQAYKKLGKDAGILPFGIPINEKFSSKISKQEARALLGIEDKRTVFVISGSMGYGNMSKHIRRLDSLDFDFQILSVCGRNKRGKQAIDKLETKKKVYNYGYVNNVDVMMDAADVIITKPGGLTSSEALAKGLPMILMNPIPGQEDRNAEFFLNNGVATMISSTFPVDECLFEILDNDWRLSIMEEAVAKISKPHAAKNLGEFIIELCNSEVC